MSKLIKKFRSLLRVMRIYGFSNMLRFVKSKLCGTVFIPKGRVASSGQAELSASEALYRSLQPIPSIHVNDEVRRLNVVTDSIASDSLLGGVATALIVATEFARRNNMSLRIITRTEPTVPQNYVMLLKNNGLPLFEDVTFYSDYDRDINGVKRHKLEVSPTDVFFATSWWSATAIRKTSIRQKFYYIIQEVETFFYPHGEEHYLCSRLLEDENIDYIINSKYLYDYFKIHSPQVTDNGVYFNPAFSESIFHREVFRKQGEKYKMFFYARPNNPRNMYRYGVELINLGIQRGVIDTKQWDIYFAGADIGKATFVDGSIPKMLGLMTWREYADFLATVDLTISLMYTPHPSYPPYDTICSGGVVLTNRCLNKTEFLECDNIIMADLKEEEFLQGIKQAIELAVDYSKREENYKKSSVPRDWNVTLQDTFQFMEEKL